MSKPVMRIMVRAEYLTADGMPWVESCTKEPIPPRLATVTYAQTSFPSWEILGATVETLAHRAAKLAMNSGGSFTVILPED